MARNLFLDLEDPLPPQVSDYERRAAEGDADPHRRERLVHGVRDDEGGRAGAAGVERIGQFIRLVGEMDSILIIDG